MSVDLKSCSTRDYLKEWEKENLIRSLNIKCPEGGSVTLTKEDLSNVNSYIEQLEQSIPAIKLAAAKRGAELAREGLHLTKGKYEVEADGCFDYGSIEEILQKFKDEEGI